MFEKSNDTCERVERSWLELPGDLQALPEPSRGSDGSRGAGWRAWLGKNHVAPHFPK